MSIKWMHYNVVRYNLRHNSKWNLKQMPKISMSLDHLDLTKNAQFYRLKDSSKNINQQDIDTIFSAACQNQHTKDEFILNIPLQDGRTDINEITYKSALRVFAAARPVYFLSESNEYQDIIHAYIILIQYGDYVVILKKSCAPIDSAINKLLVLVDYQDLIDSFKDNEVSFQKLALRNMTVSDKALRSRSYEARNLNGLLSMHAAGRSIPYYLKIRDSHGIKSFTMSAGRITESSQRIKFDDIVLWVKEQIDLFGRYSNNKQFMNSFAKKVDLGLVLNSCDPIAIMVEAGSVDDYLEKEGLIIYRRKNGQLKPVSNKFKEQLISELEKTYDLDHTEKVTNSKDSAKLRRNINTLSFSSKILSKLFVELIINNKKSTVTLSSLIIKNGWFSVCFDDPKFMYFAGACFEDTSGISEIDSILDMLQVKTQLNGCTSEKGKFSANHKKFSKNSIFDTVEKIHVNDDYLFCDDLGDEWADHIAINLKKLSIDFIHSKHGKKSNSASMLHDVVGQGIKNLGNMFFSNNQFFNKFTTTFLHQTYNSGCGVHTQIKRIRKGGSKPLQVDLVKLLSNYNIQRQCILCCNFLSKNSLQVEFYKLKNKIRIRGNIIQLLWILSSFSHACREMNVRPIIYCKK